MYSGNYKLLLQETEDDLNQGLTNYGLQLLQPHPFVYLGMAAFAVEKLQQRPYYLGKLTIFTTFPFTENVSQPFI